MTIDYKVEAGNLNTKEHVLASLRFALSPSASPGLLDTVARREIFHTPTEVTGEILRYYVNINGVLEDWGVETSEGDIFRVEVFARYHAPGDRHTRMDLTVWKPESGDIIYANDDDLWDPIHGYEDPDTEIHFIIRTLGGGSWVVNEIGTWEAKLEYVWVE